MGFWDWLSGRNSPPPPALAEAEVDPAPTEADIMASLEAVDQLISSGTLPAVVRSRAARVTSLVRKTLPRLGSLGSAAMTVTRWWPPRPTTCPRRSVPTCGCRGIGPIRVRSRTARLRCCC